MSIDAKDLLEKLLTVKDVADRTRLHPATVYQAAQNRQLRGIRFGRSWRFRLVDVERWWEKNTRREWDSIVSRR